MKKTIIITPFKTKRAGDFIAALLENSEFADNRICAELGKPLDQESEEVALPLELEYLPWHYGSLFAETGAQLSIFNHFSGYPEEVLVVYDTAVFFEAAIKPRGFSADAISIMMALPKLLHVLLEENPEPWKLYLLMFKQSQTGIVSETVTGALAGFCKGLQSAGNSSKVTCSIIEDASGMLPLFASYCIKLFNNSQKESKNYIFTGKTGLFGKY